MGVLEAPIREAQRIRNYINGEWTESTGEYHDVVNPATGETIAYVPHSTDEVVASAVAAAVDAYPEWRRTTPVARARMLFRLKKLMEENFETASRIQTQEHGKTIDGSRGETRRGIENVEVACGIPSLMQGAFSQDVASGIDEWLIPSPLGVFGVIAPFNFPWMIPLWSAPYAVATGDCVVVKPSDEVPLSQDFVARLVEEAGFTPGVWNVVHGGASAGGVLLDHPDTCFLGPTIFEDVNPKSTIGLEEIFGPVMGLMRVSGLDEAIHIANENPYGNGHSILTQDGRVAREFAYNVESGNVGINVGIMALITFFPFGGMKDSFFGVLHTQGRDAIRFFTESKVVIQRWF